MRTTSPPRGTNRPQLSLGRRFTELAANDPSAPAVTSGSATLTRAEVESAANKLARAYRQFDVKAGDLVSVALPNGSEFVIACLALWKLGAIPQPLAAQLPGAERQKIVELAHSRLVIGVEEGLHGATPCIPVGFAPPMRTNDAPLPDAISPAWKAPTSGGSTGRPKIIMATQRGVFDDRIAKFLGIEDRDRQLIAGPLYHNGPFLFAMHGLFQGNHLIVLPRFEAGLALDVIDQYQVSLLMVVPTMMSRMLGEYELGGRHHSLSSIRRFWHMAAACPAWLKRRWIDILGPETVYELYGATEGHAVTVIGGAEWLEHPGSVGRPSLGEMVIFDDGGTRLPAGEVGEIFMRPRSNRPTYRYIGAEPRARDGWESVGDMGWMDEDGYLYVADRRQDLILRGGANVYPAEVEAALSEHPSVISCAVVGVPDPDLGQRVHAVVELSGQVPVEDLSRHMEERLARYKVPQSWEIVDRPVRDDAGKVRRSALAQRSLAAESLVGQTDQGR